jgi:hypothetical protein
MNGEAKFCCLHCIPPGSIELPWIKSIKEI